MEPPLSLWLETRDAVRRGDVEAILRYVQDGYDVNHVAVESFDRTLLHFAIRARQFRAAETILQNPASSGSKSNEYQEHLDALNRQEEVVEMLLQAGASVHSNHANKIPLYYAVNRWGHLGVTRLLLRAGSPVDEMDPKGHTALRMAFDSRNWQIVDLLLQHGASTVALTRPQRVNLVLRSSLMRFVANFTGSNRGALIEPSHTEEVSVLPTPGLSPRPTWERIGYFGDSAVTLVTPSMLDVTSVYEDPADSIFDDPIDTIRVQ